MLKSVFLGALVLTSITSAVYAGGPEYISTASTTGSFNAVNVDGYVNVMLRPSSQTSVTTTGAKFNPVQTYVSHHTLYIQTPWRPQTQTGKRPVVTVNLRELDKLTVSGQANVAASNIHSHALSITSEGSGKIKLIGMLNIKNINQTGNNRIYLRWIDSITLSINSSGDGFIYLGGVANTLYARVYGHAVLNAQYLRTKMVQVQTKNEAAAFVYPVTTLRAFANNHGNIYYYAYPKNITRYSIQSGNILQMAWRP